MAINLNTYEVQTRERRLNSITGYIGTIGDIAKQAEHCGICDRKRCFSQNSACMSGCAQGYLSAITDAAVINHAPIGCLSDSMGANNARKWGEFAQGLPHRDLMMFSTNMNENDTVFGATQKLTNTIKEVNKKYHPAAIFVTTSCTSAIIGEDIGSVTTELGLQLGLPIIPVFCEGFKTKIWASGFDAAFHAILAGIVKPPTFKRNVVNVINFRASYQKQIEETFAEFGVKPFFVAGYCTVEELTHLSESAATVSICGVLGTYLGNGLEQAYGVPYLKSVQPHGVEGYEEWLRGLGQILHKEGVAEKLIARERARAIPQIEKLRKQLSGRRAVVGMGPSFAFNFTRLLQELGIEVVWSAAWHLDQSYDHGSIPESIPSLAGRLPDLPVSVCAYQYGEIINILNKLRPDLYLYRHPSNASWIMKLGISPVSLIDEYMGFGYDGLISLGKTIADTLQNRNFEKNISKHTHLPYSSWWLERGRKAFFEKETVS
ncbi:MAG: nitrogenase component 1 [Ethanoligenens sp.]